MAFCLCFFASTLPSCLNALVALGVFLGLWGVSSALVENPLLYPCRTGSELRECKTWLPPRWRPLEFQECWWAVFTFCRALSHEAVATHSLCCEPWRRQLMDNWPRGTERAGEQLLGQYAFLWWSHPFLPLLWMRRWQLLGVGACPGSGLLQGMMCNPDTSYEAWAQPAVLNVWPVADSAPRRAEKGNWALQWGVWELSNPCDKVEFIFYHYYLFLSF